MDEVGKLRPFVQTEGRPWRRCYSKVEHVSFRFPVSQGGVGEMMLGSAKRWARAQGARTDRAAWVEVQVVARLGAWVVDT